MVSTVPTHSNIKNFSGFTVRPVLFTQKQLWDLQLEWPTSLSSSKSIIKEELYFKIAFVCLFNTSGYRTSSSSSLNEGDEVNLVLRPASFSETLAEVWYFKKHEWFHAGWMLSVGCSFGWSRCRMFCNLNPTNWTRPCGGLEEMTTFWR